MKLKIYTKPRQELMFGVSFSFFCEKNWGVLKQFQIKLEKNHLHVSEMQSITDRILPFRIEYSGIDRVGRSLEWGCIDCIIEPN